MNRQSYPRLTVMLEDMRDSGEQFTIGVLSLDAGFHRGEGGARYPATRSFSGYERSTS